MPADIPPKRTLFTGKFISIAARGKWEFATRETAQPAIAVVAVTDDQRIVLVEQHRPPLESATIELPAGLTGDSDDSAGEALVEAAKRELLEETGYTAQRWTELVHGYSSPGLTDESVMIFLAEGLSKTNQGGGVEGEDITLHEVPLAEVIPWLRNCGLLIDFKILAGLMLAEHHRRQPTANS